MKNQTFRDILAWKKEGVCVALYSVCVPSNLTVI